MTQYIFLANNKIYINVIIYYLLIFLVDDLQIVSVFCSIYFPQQFWKNFHLDKGNNTAIVMELTWHTWHVIGHCRASLHCWKATVGWLRSWIAQWYRIKSACSWKRKKKLLHVIASLEVIPSKKNRKLYLSLCITSGFSNLNLHF